MHDSTSENQQRDWAQELNNLAYAYGGPQISGQMKARPEDFRVIENLNVDPCGDGEHYWLRVSKTKCNTDQVAKALARFANVAYRDVGYSGMKDFFAVTEQWFSVWLPGRQQPNWAEFDSLGVSVIEVTRHVRKIKRGTHKTNSFEIQISSINGSLVPVMQTLEKIKSQGVPNYFGPQRFGRNADNMNQALSILSGGKRPKNRNLHSLLLSAARSWLFNKVVSARVEQDSWQTLLTNEHACLDGSNSLFISDGANDQELRLASMDIHPSAPMWGQGHQRIMINSPDMHNWELGVLAREHALCEGLERARLDYGRRAIRSHVHNLSTHVNERGIILNFELQRGQFATSVLRELVQGVVA